MEMNRAFEVSVGPDVYNMTAEVPGMTEKDNKGWHYTECGDGSFQRVFTLPTEIMAVCITANLPSGVLHVRLPKTARAVQATRQIRIQSDD